jgi:RsiW-degrading membrane proteinase PrsW (M82 family)
MAAPAADQSVWDEVAVSPELAGRPGEGAVTYARWFEERRAGFGWGRSWGVVALVALAAGPWAVLGALYSGGQSWSGVLATVVFAPVVEEMLKVALAMYLVEKRPYVFRSAGQIVVCGLAGGAAFGVIENLMYLHVYVPDPTPGLVAWRWTVCTGLHVMCSAVTAVGLARVWRRTERERVSPDLSLAAPWVTAAMVLHGAYNGFAVGLEIWGFEF